MQALEIDTSKRYQNMNLHHFLPDRGGSQKRLKKSTGVASCGSWWTGPADSSKGQTGGIGCTLSDQLFPIRSAVPASGGFVCQTVL